MFFLEVLTLEEGTYTLSRNVGKVLPLCIVSQESTDLMFRLVHIKPSAGLAHINTYHVDIRE
jgi:hypothetical protein